VPEHQHGDYEHILVLQGSQRDANGCYSAGSLLVSPPGSRHAVTSDEGCVVLAIWAAPIEFSTDGSTGITTDVIQRQQERAEGFGEDEYLAPDHQRRGFIGTDDDLNHLSTDKHGGDDHHISRLQG